MNITGFCPTQAKEYSITIDYLCTNTVETVSGNDYLKGLSNCRYASTNECSFSNDCPLYNKAPVTLHTLN